MLKMRAMLHTILCMCLAMGTLMGTVVSAEEEETAALISWPGDDKIEILDMKLGEDMSGLDFADQRLYAVDNKTSRIWILERDRLGKLEFASGFEAGKPVRFAQKADREGPDIEGVTAAGDGLIYLASERDEANSAIDNSSILQVDVHTEDAVLTVQRQWNLSPYLPETENNKGIEAVEWVAFDALAGNLWDQGANAVFDPKLYPDAVAEGVFFVALESNGHVYGYILKEDGSCVQIADIDSRLGMAMALDFDAYENILWVAADDGCENRLAQIKLNKTAEPLVTHVLPSKVLDKAANNEGFAIVPAELTDSGCRSVYRVTDGMAEGALKEEWIDSSYRPHFREWLERRWLGLVK